MISRFVINTNPGKNNPSEISKGKTPDLMQMCIEKFHNNLTYTYHMQNFIHSEGNK